MSDTAKRRLEAVGQQLTGPMSESLPDIHQVAAAPTEPRVAGKVVIITGANSLMGIGRAAAYQFAASGAQALYLCDFDDANLAAQESDLRSRFPATAVYTRRFDAADEAAVRAVVDEAVQSHGRLDIFFANAGIIGSHATFDAIASDQFMETLRVNTLSCFLAAKYAAPAMRRTSPTKPASSGSIIMTASVAGLRSNAGPTPYSASKAAVISLAQSTSFQLAGTGIRVNAVCPGLIETGMTAATFQAARARGTQGRIGQLNPTRRAGHSDEIARVVLFLGSDESSYVNGQAWAVDGGLSAGHPFVLGKLA